MGGESPFGCMIHKKVIMILINGLIKQKLYVGMK